jgi:hypothetical protein
MLATLMHVLYLAIFACSIISRNKITKCAHSLATVLTAAVPSCVCFEHLTGHCCAGHVTVSRDVAAVVCSPVSSPKSKEVPCSRIVHPVSGIHTVAFQGCPVHYSTHSYNKYERDFSHLGVDESSTM